MTELRLGQLSVDTTKHTVEITAVAAILDPKTGVAAWYRCGGSVWGKETQQKLRELIEAMEHDMARQVMEGYENLDGTTSPRPAQAAGIGEHVSEDDPPQM